MRWQAAVRPERAIARLMRDGRPVGLAFPVDERHLVTCAHVVNAALGRPALSQCTVAGWLPERSDFDRNDVAILRLSVELPEGAGPLVLAGGDPTGEVQMWGPSADRSTPGHVTGRLMGEVEDGRWQVDQRLQGGALASHVT